MSLKAIGKSIIVTIDYDTKYKNVIIIPDTAIRYKEHFYVAKIISVGSKCGYDLKIGDRILLRQYETGHEGLRFYYEGETYYKLKERWIEAKVI